MAAMEKVRLGLIGYGRIGQFHAKMITTSMTGVLGWISDINPDVVHPVARDLGTQFISMDQLDATLQSPPGDAAHVDGVLICSPTTFHPTHVEMCLNHRKPVFCEKPLTADVGRLRRLFLLALEKGVFLRIGYQRVFDRDMAHLITRVQQHCKEHKTSPWSISMRSYDSPLAPPEYLRVSGPVFLDSLSHDFHVASSLLSPGDVVVSAQAKEVPFEDASLGARTAAAIFRTERNTLITSEFHRVSQFGYDNTIDVTFPNQAYRLQSRPRHALTEADGTGVLKCAGYDTGFMTKYENAYRAEIATFLEEVAQGSPLNHPHHMETCLSAVRMVKMAIDGAQTGNEIHAEHDQE